MAAKNFRSFPILFSLFLIVSTNIQALNPYAQQAQEWVQENLARVSDEELELIANLFYWSYKRSMSTLEAQRASIIALEIVWQNWLNVARTRLNPSKQLPYPFSTNLLAQESKRFEEACKEHRDIGIVYSNCIEGILKGNLVNTQLREEVEEVRTSARKAIYSGIFGSMVKSPMRLEPEEEACTSGLLTMLKNFWEALPQMTVNGFVDFDRRYNELSDQCWESFMKAHEHTNKLWQRIEESRVQFYEAYYQAIKDYISTNKPQLTVRYAFDRHGFVAQAERKEPLPIF